MKKNLLTWKILLMVFFNLSAINAFAQVSNYTFSQSSGTYTSVPSPTSIHPTNWDDNVATVTIPFSFNFNGIGYTSTSVNSNGFITFGSTPSGTTYFTPISGTTAYAGAISAFGRDLINNGATIVSGTEGVAPNRVFVIQWNNARRYNGGAVTGDILNFQIRLYETSNKAEVRYGTNTITSTGALTSQVGLRGTTNGDYNNRLTATSWSATTTGGNNAVACTTSNTILPASGLTFTWTPPVACTTPSAQPTSLIFGTTTATSVAGSFTAAIAAPSGYMVVRSTSATAPTPVNGTSYAVASTALGAGTYVVQNGTVLTFADIGLTSNTKYYYYLFSYNNACTGTPYYLATSPLSGNQTTCAGAPTGAVNGAITTNSFAGSWTASPAGGGAGIITYTMEVHSNASYTALVNSATGTAVSNTITGLNPSIAYWWRVKATNGFCESTYLNGGTFTTACAPITSLPWTENFDGIATIGSGIVPSCWSNVTGTKAWVSANAATDAYNDPKSAPNYMSIAYSNGTASQIWTPTFALTSGISYDISFYYNTGTGTTNTGWTGKLLVNNSQTLTGATELATFVSATQTTTGYVKYTYSYTPSLGGNYTFAISVSSTSVPWNLGVDDFKLELTPSCQVPVAAFGSSAITTNSATISWGAPASIPAGGYEYYYSTSNTAPLSSAAIISGNIVPTTSANISSIPNSNQLYYWWVRSVCNAGTSTTSTWASGGGFVTSCPLPTEPTAISFTSVSAVATTVNWVAPTTVPTAYVVFRSTSSTPPALTNGIQYAISQTAVIASLTSGANTYYCISNGTGTSGTATSLTGNTKYYYYIFSRNGTNGTAPDCNGAPWYATSNLNDSQITCPTVPTLPVVSALGSTNATVSWTASAVGGSASTINYTLEVYSDSYITPIAGSPFILGTAVTNALTGLTAATPYYYRIKANNGSCDSAYLMGSFTTACAIITAFPYTMGFDLTAPCWTVSSGTSIWGYAASSTDIAAPQSGSGFIYKPYTSSTQYLYSPGMDLSAFGTNQAQLNFWIYRHADTVAADQISFKVNTSASNTGATNLQTFPIITTSAPAVAASGWYNYKIDVPVSWNSAGTIYFVIEGKTTAGFSSYDIGLDNFIVEEKPAPINVNSSATLPTCDGSSTTLTASSSKGYTYTWSPATGLNSTVGSSVIASPNFTTTYTVTGTAGNVTNTKSFIVMVNSAPSSIVISESNVSSGSNTDCDIDLVKLDAAGAMSNQIVFSENFNTVTPGLGNLPAGWSRINGSTTFRWGVFAANDAGGDPNEMRLLYNSSGTDATGNWFLNTPSINSTGFTGMKASFKYRFGFFSPGSVVLKLQTSTDNVGWTDRWSQVFTSASGADDYLNVPVAENIDLSALNGASIMYFRFVVNGNSEIFNYFALDDIVVTGKVQQPITWTPAAGLFTDVTMTTPYVAGTNAITVYAAPNTGTSYTANSTISPCSQSKTSTSVIGTQKVFTGLAAISTDKVLWNVAENWTNNQLPTLTKCVVIPNGQNVKVNISTAVAKNVTVDAGGYLTISPDQALTVTDIFTNSNVQNLVAASSPKQYYVTIENDGNLLQTNKVTNVGAIAARREINIQDHNQYNYAISPLLNTNLNTNIYEDQTSHNLSNAPFTLYHNEATNKFYTSSGAYIAGRGLAVKEPATGTGKINMLFTGVPVNGSVPYTLVNTTPLDAVHGYNLIGNPYPSNLDLVTFYTENNTSGKLDPTFYFWDSTANSQTTQAGNSYGGEAYAKFNATTPPGVGTPTLATGDAAIAGTKSPTRYVKVGQGFMARTSAASLPVSFENTQRASKSATGFFGKGAQEAAPFDRYWLNMTSSTNITSQIAVVYFAGGNDAYTKDDSRSLLGSDAIYSIVDSQPISINGKNAFANTDVVSLGSSHFASGTYTVALGDKKDGVFANGQSIYLKDKQTGIITNLSQGNYTFAANAGGSSGRFEIIYQPEIVLATDSAVKEDLVIYRDGGDFVVKAQSKKITALDVFDGVGRLIFSMKPNNLKVTIPADQLINGVYILKIDQGGKITTKKVIR